jgi:hypothetical protein
MLGAMERLCHEESIVVAASPQGVYELVSDVTRTGEFSPVCKACWWDEGGGPRVGAWFTGRNEVPGRTWETRSLVVAATPGEEFAWCVGGDLVRWGYRLREVPTGTLLTQTWDFLPAGLNLFQERYGVAAAAQIQDRTESALRTMPLTLQALKVAAERGPA